MRRDAVTLEAERRRRQQAASPADAIIVREAPDYVDWIQDEVTIEDPHKAGTNAIIKFILWKEQIEYLHLLHKKKQTITLKARQLGVSWVTIAYCVWLCIFHSNVTVLVFSKDKEAAEEIIRRARGIFKRLANQPTKEVGKESMKTLNFSNGSRFKAFAATKNAGTSFTATFLIVDEADKMEFGKQLYTSIRPTIDDGGRIAIIFTAFEENGMGRIVWGLADSPDSTITRYFIPWWARPGRTQEWYNRVASTAISMAYHKQEYPATAEEALGFTGLDSRLVRDLNQWMALDAGAVSSHLPCILAVDAGVSSDLFVAVSACWHPEKILPVIRDVKTWKPGETASGQVDFKEAEEWIKRFVSERRVLQVVYDPYQLVSFGQSMEGYCHIEAFPQGTKRISADSGFRNRIIQGELLHTGDKILADHVMNANIKVSSIEEKKIRIVKRAKAKKIDLAVAASMAVWQLVSEYPFGQTENSPIGSTPEPIQAIQGFRAFQGMPNSIYKGIKRRSF